jgi:hypothetical protein
MNLMITSNVSYSSAAAGISPVLREVDVPCISNAECAATYGATITDGNICVDTTGGKGSCNVIFKNELKFRFYSLVNSNG